MKSTGYSNICKYINTYMHAITINAKRTHEFGEWLGAYGRVLREESKGGNLITLKSQKKQKINANK